MTHDFSFLERSIAAYAPIPASVFEQLTSATRVETFEEGAILLRQGEPVKCEIASKELIYDGLLNAEFCRRFVLTFDLEQGRTWATPRE